MSNWINFSFQDLNAVAFRFKDKERPRGYTSKIAGILHVSLMLFYSILWHIECFSDPVYVTFSTIQIIKSEATV